MSRTFSWADGEGGTKTFVLNVQGDTTSESNETIILTLETPVNCEIGAGQATATILNDDSAAVSVVNLSVAPSSQSENTFESLPAAPPGPGSRA